MTTFLKYELYKLKNKIMQLKQNLLTYIDIVYIFKNFTLQRFGTILKNNFQLKGNKVFYCEYIVSVFVS